MNRWRCYLGLAAAVGLTSAVLSSMSSGTVIAQGNSAATLNCDIQPCDAVARGRAAFNSRNPGDLGGNGRACADCHMPSEAFQLSPAAARARFDALVARRAEDPDADDPLFRPVDADDFRVNGDTASRFLESRRKRARARDDALAIERQAHRSRNGSTVG